MKSVDSVYSTASRHWERPMYNWIGASGLALMGRVYIYYFVRGELEEL